MLELQRNLYVLRHWWWVILGAAVAAGLVAYAVTKVITKPQYQSTAIVALAPEDPSGVFAAGADAQLIPTLSTAQRVRHLLPGIDPTKLSGRIESSASVEGQLLYVTVRWPDASLAPRLANAVSQVFIQEERRRLESRYRVIHSSLVSQERQLRSQILATKGSGSATNWLQSQYADTLSKIYQQDAQSRLSSSMQERALVLAQPAVLPTLIGTRASVNAALGAVLGLLVALVFAFVATTTYDRADDPLESRPVLTKVGD